MTSRDFAYWLMGYFEISKTEEISPDQVRMIKNHLNLVFTHEIDPSLDGGDEIKKQKMQLLHDGKDTDVVYRC